MSKARKLAWIRFLAFCVGLFFPLLVFAVVRIVWGEIPATMQWLQVVAGVVPFIVGMSFCVYVLCFWRPRCPQCGARARFEYGGQDKEYLACAGCGYHEATGWEKGTS